MFLADRKVCHNISHFVNLDETAIVTDFDFVIVVSSIIQKIHSKRYIIHNRSRSIVAQEGNQFIHRIKNLKILHFHFLFFFSLTLISTLYRLAVNLQAGKLMIFIGCFYDISKSLHCKYHAKYKWHTICLHT